VVSECHIHPLKNAILELRVEEKRISRARWSRPFFCEAAMPKKGKRPPSPDPEPLPVIDSSDSAQVRGLIRELVMAAAGQMVQAAIERAKTGHDQIIKYLFEIAGLFPELAAENPADEFSLARHLCERLGLPPAPEPPPAPVQGEILAPLDPAPERGNGHALK
jgi:hypothetical protein